MTEQQILLLYTNKPYGIYNDVKVYGVDLLLL